MGTNARHFWRCIAVASYVLLAASASGVRASTAGVGASIRPGWGIEPVKLGLSVRDVRTRLGFPDRISYPNPRFRRDAPVLRYHYRDDGLTVDFRRGRGYVWRIATALRHYRTASGLRVGSSEASVRGRLGDEFCKVTHGTGYCVVGGSRATFFYLRRGRVSSVAVQLVRGGY